MFTPVNPATLLTFVDISDNVMQSVWNLAPIDFQRETIPRVLMIRCAPYYPQALLLVKLATGGGKSAVA